MSRQNYGTISWTPEDVQYVKPQWSLNKCRIFLEAIEHKLEQAMIEAGGNTLDILIGLEDLNASEHTK